MISSNIRRHNKYFQLKLQNKSDISLIISTQSKLPMPEQATMRKMQRSQRKAPLLNAMKIFMLIS